jgi:hypothetical protein
MENCLFKNNTASATAAVTVSYASNVVEQQIKNYATIRNVTFDGNKDYARVRFFVCFVFV